MILRSPYEVGQLIRSRREARGLTQADFALSVGVSRKWVVEAEAGKPTAEIGLILRALAVLGVALAIEDESTTRPSSGRYDDIPDVNDVLAAYSRAP